jgi:alpha-N-acetylglucosamine transferase
MILTGEGDNETDIKDPYFTAAHLVTYQLLHSPHTKSSSDIPVLILVTEDVPQEQRDILSRDGTIIVPVEGFSREWIHPKWERWNGVLAKLNLWKLTEYEKITFLDADSIIFEPIDGIFTERATMTQITRPSSSAINMPGPIPDSYMIAGMHDRWVEAELPPVPGRDFYAKDNYMNAGFFVLAPSEAMFEYYLFLLDQPGLFDPAYPEQNLLNYAHRVDGRMPWQDVGPIWSQKGSSFEHYDPSLKSLHQKWWKTSFDQTFDERIANAMAELKDYVEKHHEGTMQPRSP